MKTARRWIEGFCALTLVASHVLADVKIDDAQRKDIGIETTTLALTEVAPVWKATAQVLDPTPLITQLNDLQAAQSAANASRHELERAEQLYKAESNVSYKALEAARTQSFTDAGHFDSLRAQLVTSWGTAFAHMDQAAREHLMQNLLSGEVALIRAETIQSVAANADVRSASIQSLSDNRIWTAQILGSVAQSAGQVVGNAYLLQVSARLQPGSLLAAELHDNKHAQRRIKIPRGALIRWLGSTWLFIENSPNEFVRQAVQIDDCFDDGCLLKTEMRPGQHVVTTGVPLLLAAENGHPSED